MKKSKYWCDVCKEEKDFSIIIKGISLPIDIIITDEFIKPSYAVTCKKMDICRECLDKIIKKINEVIAMQKLDPKYSEFIKGE